MNSLSIASNNATIVSATNATMNIGNQAINRTSSWADLLITAPVLLRHTSSVLSLAPNETSNHIGGKNNTNDMPLSPMVFGDGNGNGNGNHNNNAITHWCS